DDDDDDDEEDSKILSDLGLQEERRQQRFASLFEDTLLESTSGNRSSAAQEASIFERRGGKSENWEALFGTMSNPTEGLLPVTKTDLPKDLFDFDMSRFVPPSASATALKPFLSKGSSTGMKDRQTSKMKRGQKLPLSFETLLAKKLFEQKKKRARPELEPQPESEPPSQSFELPPKRSFGNAPVKNQFLKEVDDWLKDPSEHSTTK
ncbi:hypothetical protein RFI_33503, partial [Reticulomyxa filosa]